MSRSGGDPEIQTAVDETDRDADIAWLEVQLKKFPVWTRNQDLCQKALQILEKWRLQFKDDFNTWRKIKKRAAKELNESEPMIMYIMDFVNRRRKEGSCFGEKLTIVDVCSGFGIFSMFLSELLPPQLVDRIWLVDYNFPYGNTNTPPHIQQIFYDTEWPIPLRIRKTNIKKSREIRQLHERVLNPSPGPIIMVGVHLCKALSVHAIKLYQDCSKAEALMLKPCCLPGKNRKDNPDGEPIVWRFANGYEFGPHNLYCKEASRGNYEVRESVTEEVEANKKSSDEETAPPDDMADTNMAMGPQTSHGGKGCTNVLFSRWVGLLEKACKDDASSRVVVEHFDITFHHFQNKFIVCERIAA